MAYLSVYFSPARWFSILDQPPTETYGTVLWHAYLFACTSGVCVMTCYPLQPLGNPQHFTFTTTIGIHELYSIFFDILFNLDFDFFFFFFKEKSSIKLIAQRNGGGMGISCRNQNVYKENIKNKTLNKYIGLKLKDFNNIKMFKV